MTVELPKETRDRLVRSIRRFAQEELEQDWGDLKATLVLDFALAEIAPSAYNQGVADAQRALARALDDVAGVVYESEFAYWKR